MSRLLSLLHVSSASSPAVSLGWDIHYPAALDALFWHHAGPDSFLAHHNRNRRSQAPASLTFALPHAVTPDVTLKLAVKF